jgi:TonB-dependent starch-binding outer membrane protein SusC
MKKKLRLNPFLRQIMRFTATQMIMTVLFCVSAYAHNAHAQDILDQRITLNVQSDKIKTVLKDIESQAHFKFIFSSNAIQADNKISVFATNETVKSVLDKILPPLSIAYKVSDKRILLFKTEVQLTKTSAIEVQEKEKQELTVEPVLFIVSGTVTDEQGAPLVGASVVLKGTTKGAVTDVNGNYQLELGDAEKNGILLISFVGYEAQEIDIAGQKLVNVRLISGKALNEVVVVGYGQVRKRDLTGSVVSIGTKELSEQPVHSLNQALQGRVSGVQITNSSNAPGGGVTVRVRGGNSISASNDPLYVIDGFPVTNPSPASGATGATFFANPLATINPNDIESIEVLKDASATAIYGSRGANGVVLVTTKRGKEGKSNIDFEAYYGSQEITKMLDLVTGEQHTAAKNEQLRNLGFAERYGNSAAYPKKPAEYGEGTNWQKEIYRVAPMQSYQLSFTGGTEKLRYAISGNYFNQDGIIITTNYKRYNMRVNLDAKINNRLKIGTNFTVTRSTNRNVNEIGNNGIIGAAVSISPASPIFDANGNYQLLNVGPGSGFNPYSNPVAIANTSTNRLLSDRVLGNVFGDISIIEGLTARISVGADIFNTRRNIFFTPETLIANTLNGYGSNGTSNNLNLLNENTLTYTKKVNNHAFDVVGGVTFQNNREERTYAEAQDFPNFTLGANNIGLANKPLPATGSVQEWGLNSYLGRVNYRLNDRYLVTLTGRVDGSSRFGNNNKYGFFPSGALAWRVSDENFLKNNKVMSDLKLRVSYGITGNDGIGLYNSLSSYSTGRTVFGDVEVLTTSAGRLANPDLRWEKTGQFDAGFDLGLLDNRIQITADYYVKTTSDLLLGVELPATTGFTSVIRNVGSLENRGFELGINTVNIDKAFKWRTNGNISFNRNKVLKLNDATEFFVSSTFGTGTSIVRVGEPVGSFYGNVFDGIWQTAEEIKAAGGIARAGDLPGAIKYKDLDGDGVFNPASDRKVLGNGLPKFIFGLTNNFSYRGFDLSIFLQGVQGNTVHNWARRTMETSDPSAAILKSYYEGAWRADKPSTTLPSIRQWRPTGTDSYFMEDGSFVRLKNVLLSYTIPLNTKFIKRARVYVSGQNLMTFTKYRGYDPEVNSDFNSNTSYGVDVYAYPAAKTFTVGANLSF